MIIIKKKKLLTGLLIGSLALLCFASGAVASSHLTKITAYLNSAISVELKGKTLNLSQSQPITYNNTTYLPLRTIAEATGLDVKWNAENQRISLNDKVAKTPGARTTFSKDKVVINKTFASELLLKPKNIEFSDKQYNEVVSVSEIGYAGKGFTLTFPEGTSKIGVTFGAQGKGTDYEKIKYKVIDLDGNIISFGEMEHNSTKYVEFELSDAGNKLEFSFEAKSYSNKLTAFLVYDESWYE
ncbi:stalk domain-containing protein [Paenibacillus camelliae]|uniref:stalk domain-containing protein n=1 Tax=Paenibacillus camelliae TaxID=512410 RepID=UPI00203E2BE8|nr:stalk domain-containing protein [Paenibacillus camelliae]MCM3632911.1 copper amine oxidase N-terminal domain-containing protein [Paenibacillus camelliae]